MGKRESTNMANIGLQQVGHHYAHYLATLQCISIIKFYIIMHTILQRCNQNYIHDVITIYVIILICQMSLNKSFIILTKLAYIGACIFDLSLVLVKQFHMHS